MQNIRAQAIVPKKAGGVTHRLEQAVLLFAGHWHGVCSGKPVFCGRKRLKQTNPAV